MEFIVNSKFKSNDYWYISLITERDRSTSLISNPAIVHNPGSIPCTSYPHNLLTRSSFPVSKVTAFQQVSPYITICISFRSPHPSWLTGPSQRPTLHYPSTIYLPMFDHPNKNGDKQYKLWRSSLFNFRQSSDASSLFRPIILITLYSNNHKLCSSLNERDKILHRHRTADTTVVLHISIFTCLSAVK